MFELGIDGAWLASATAYVGDVWTEMNLIILLVIGIPLGFYVIRKVISLVGRLT